MRDYSDSSEPVQYLGTPLRIALSNGGYAIIDDFNYKIISSYSWFSQKPTGSTVVYAWCNLWKSREDGSKYRTKQTMHKMLHPDWEFIDHRDHNGLNNLEINLRKSTKSLNAANQRKPKHRSALIFSSFKGVFNKKDKWIAGIKKDGNFYYLGTFLTDLEAAIAYDIKAVELFGEYAYPNFDVTLYRGSD